MHSTPALGRIFFAGILLFAFAAQPAQAATWNGTISGDTIWTKADSPYIVSYVSIPQGSSLTIEPGVIVKIVDGSNPFTIDGILTLGASGAEPVTITSLEDDSVGGDTNGDGTTTSPHPGSWNQITMNPGARVMIVNTAIRYGGATPYNSWTGGYFTLPLIANNGGTLSIDHSTFTESGYYGIRQISGTTTVTNSMFGHVGNWGIYSTQGSLTVASTTFDTMERGVAASGGTLELGGNTFTNLTSRYAISVDGLVTQFVNHGGNGGQGGILLGLSVDGDCTLSKDGLPYIPRYVAVSVGSTLTIAPGVVMKVSPSTNPFIIDGTLIVGSAGAEPVILTSLNDDSVGGDTNGDGTTTMPQRGDWRTITFNPSSTGAFTNTIIRYGGRNEYSSYWGITFTAPMISNDGGDTTFMNATLTNAAYSGIAQANGTTTMFRSEITQNVRGLYLIGGTAMIHDSHIHDNSEYGVYTNLSNPIDATGNYWGDPSGPTNPSNPGGTGDRVSDGVNFTPWLGAWPATSTAPVCMVDCNSSVLFLPGLEASRLYAMDDPNCSFLNCENQLWEPNRNDDVRELYLDVNGKSTTTIDIYTRDIIDEVGGVAVGGNIYKSFQEKMDGLKAGHLINDWESAPYDWRLSIDDILGSGKKEGKNIFYTKATSSPYIIQELKRLAATSRTGKVTIIAHSNGGLVAKALMQKLGPDSARYVDKIIFVAVPQSGTPQAIGALLNGFSQEIPDAWYLLPVNGTVLSTSNARTLAENMQSGYNLLPSQAYFTVTGSNVTTPVVEFAPGMQTTLVRNMYGDQINHFDALQAFLRGLEGRTKPDASNVTYPNVLNGTLLTAAFQEHNLLDAWTPPAGVKVYQIAGWGIDTMETIKYKQGSYFHCYGVTPCIDYDVRLTEDGDGTVVVPSALAMSTTTVGTDRLWLNMQTYNSGITIDREHKDILEVSNLLDFLGDILAGVSRPLTNYTYLSTSTPPTTNPTKKLRYFLHSPLSLDLYDDAGHHTGISTTTGMIDSQIPGAYYRTFGEVKYITAPANTPLHLVLNGQASGYFTLDIQEVTGDTITATTSFVDIPTATSTRVTMNFTDGTLANAGPLTVDEDGNGTTDFALAPKLNNVVTLPHYSFSGFLQPINDIAYHPEQTMSVFKSGSTIPVKFQLKSATGTPVQANTSPVWLTPQKLSPMSSSPNESSSGDSGTSGTTFKWDATDQQYIYNWSTKGLTVGYWYHITTKLDDGRMYSVTVGVR